MSGRYYNELKEFYKGCTLLDIKDILSGGFYFRMRIWRSDFDKIRKELFPEEFI